MLVLLIFVLIFPIIIYGQTYNALGVNQGKTQASSWERLTLTTSISGTQQSLPTTQDEDEFIYLPLILKSGGANQPWHRLNVSKSVSNNMVQAGEVLTYTIKYTISGNEAATDLTLVDTLPQSTTFQSCMGLTCVYTTGLTSWSLGTVLAGTTGSVTMTLEVDNSVISGSIISNSVTLKDATGLQVNVSIATIVQNYNCAPACPPTINARNLNAGAEQSQPVALSKARWPFSSSIPIYLFDHKPYYNYTIKFNGQPGSSAPGTFTFNGNQQNLLPTGSQGNSPAGAYYLATGYTTPADIIITSHNVTGTQIAATMIEVVPASIAVSPPPGQQPYPEAYPANHVISITLQNHAPLQQYSIFFAAGLNSPAVIIARANENGELNLNYVIPAHVHIAGTAPLSLEIYTRDYGRGNNLHPIATKTIQFYTPGETLDIAVVFDTSNSTQFDTPCYGCYEPYEDLTGLPITDWTTLNYGHDYPRPEFLHPIPVKHLPGNTLLSYNPGLEAVLGPPNNHNANQLCFPVNPPDYYTIATGGDPQHFVMLEAELYSLNTSLHNLSFRQPGQGYWAIQHANWRTLADVLQMGPPLYNTGATPALPTYSRGSWVSHNPYISWAIPDVIPFGHDYTLAEVRANPGHAPSLEYDFITHPAWGGPDITPPGIDDNDLSSIWIRSQKGGPWIDTDGLVYWAVYNYEDLYGPLAPDDITTVTPLGSGQIEPIANTSGSNGPPYGGADANYWRWRNLTNNSTRLNLENSTRYVLKLWAGSPGYDIDQIVISNQGTIADGRLLTNNEYNNGSPAQYNDGISRTATPGSAFRMACNRCNPIYGLLINNPADCENDAATVPTTNYDLAAPTNNPLFEGYQPLRGAKEAVKSLIGKVNPEFDQLGLASFGTQTTDAGRVELRCLRDLGNICFQGASPISYTDVLNRLEIVPPYGGGTNTAGGMLRGLEMLGVNADGLAPVTPVSKGSSNRWDNDCDQAYPLTSHCARAEPTRRIMILITDGIPNANPFDQGMSAVDCRNEGVYTDNHKDCMMHYARIAQQNNVEIYTIGLGYGTDPNLLQQVASYMGITGQYFTVTSPAQLDSVWDVILQGSGTMSTSHSLDVNKMVSPTPVQAGTLLTYSIKYNVYGNEVAPDLTLVDTLPQSVTFHNCSGGPGCSYANGIVSWNLGDVLPLASGQVTLTVNVSATLISGTILYNSVTLSDTSGVSVSDLRGTLVHRNCPPLCYIIVSDEGGDYSEPAGNNFTVLVRQHNALTNYNLWLAKADGTFSDNLNFTTDAVGYAAIDFHISPAAPPTSGITPDYKIYTEELGTIIATCEGSPTNEPCFIVE